MVFQPQPTRTATVEHPLAGLEPSHRVAIPAAAELGAGRPQPIDQGHDRGIAQPVGGLGAELGEEAAAGDLPVVHQLPHRGVGEHQPQQIAIGGIDRRHVGVQRRVRAVPGHDRPVGGQRVGRSAGQLVQQALDVRRRRFDGVAVQVWRRGVAGQAEQVLVLRARKPQCRGDRIQHLPRRRDRPGLFEPGVPGHAHTAERRHLLAA